MTTYPGMSLRGEVRESVSLDEDDLSDVEDEVFIRDGKHGYKFAEEVGVKRPLMAPRRKIGKPDIATRLKSKPPCRAFCKPCCYVLAALTVLIGLIVLVVILVSMFPLPLDKFKNWIVNKTGTKTIQSRILPCSDLVVEDVWTLNLPKLTSDSPIRTLDINQDGTEDVIFGFGTGDNTANLQADIFCPIFLGVTPPCEGGVIALNGTNGDILWRYWMNDTVFSLMCTEDVNGDGLEDCLAVGNKGTMCVINAKNGSVIWQTSSNPMDIYLSNFIPDQDNDSVADILTSHSSYDGSLGHLILISGRSGKEIKRILTSRTFFMPQLFTRDNELYVLYGTGGPVSPGNLSIVLLRNLISGNLTSTTVYSDPYRGMLTQSVLVDITGDNQTDIITAMFNSTVVAINGKSLEQLWNFTVPNAVSLFVPTPAYFNGDNVTDFLIMYKKGQDISDVGLVEVFILDGKTGKSIYQKPIRNGIQSQTGSLSLMMEGHGFDMFALWTRDCIGNGDSKGNDSNLNNLTDKCSAKLNALNQFDQPPGLEIYNSAKHILLEYNNTKSPIEEAINFLQLHPHMASGQPSNGIFRNKDNKNGLIRDFTRPEQVQTKSEPEYDEDFNIMAPPNDPLEMDYNLNFNSYTPNKNMLRESNLKLNSRDPRSKEDPLYSDSDEEYTSVEDTTTEKSTENQDHYSEKPKYGIYDYKNIYNARNRLLHDLSNLPSEILRETYFKNREHQLRKSRFEQRDIKSHKDRIKENEEVRKVIDKEKVAATNVSENLWDLESEKEMEDKENGYFRGKRDVNFTSGTTQVTSVGVLSKSANETDNTIDIIFLTYWSAGYNDVQIVENILQKCIQRKIAQGDPHAYRTSILRNECAQEYDTYKRDFPYFNQLSQLRVGQMTVYKLRIRCVCQTVKVNERCAKFLPLQQQNWSAYLGKTENGLFKTRL